MPPAEELWNENQQLKQEVALLREQLGWLQRQSFGSKSEKLDARQILLALEAQEAQAKRKEEELVKVREHMKRRQPVEPPKERFKHLPVSETIEIVPEEVKAEPDAYEKIGEESTFEVVIDPPRFTRRVINRPKFRRKDDRQAAPVLAPAPPRPIEGGIASAELLAHVTLCKYVDHLPLYRQEKIFARDGIEISRKTMAGWIEIVAGWLEPVYGLMRQELILGGYIQADETPIRYLDPDLKKVKAKQGYLNVISRPGGDVVFDWKQGRAHTQIHATLEGFAGRLQSDLYGAYGEFAAKHPDSIVHVGCWAHARRYFVQAETEKPRETRRVLRLIAILYAREQQWRDQELSFPHRAEARNRKSRKTLRLLKRVITRLAAAALPKLALGKACRYALNHWNLLTAYLDHGEVEIDNNLVENAIRPSAIGKKNWLFIGHPDAGQRSAIIYSIIVSCQRRGINPRAYLIDVLKRLPNQSNLDLHRLLPSTWQPASNL